MAQAFNLTAQLNLRGPSNVRRIAADIRRELGTVSANVQFRLDPNATRNVAALNASLRNLNNTFNDTVRNANDATRAIRNFSAAVNGVNIRNIPQQLTATATSVARLNRVTASSGRQLSEAASEMQEFGKQAGLAIRRFAAFSSVTGLIYSLTNSITSGIQAFIDYDKELVRLQQVTGQSAKGLQDLQNSISSLAMSLGVSSKELTTVSVTLAQAGLSAKDTERALKALALSSLAPSFDNMNETVEGSIALMRQFGIGANQLEQALGSVNAVAAAFAVEADDLITAIQRTGGVFATASKGVSEGTDALNEFISVFTSVRATTRESAETIATGLRTIFTRIQRGSTIDALKEFGISLTDAEGKFVGAYKAIELLSKGLSQLDPRDIKFSGIVEELGGFRQIGKVIPLIQQFATAQEALKVAQQGQGSLAADAAKAQESLANRITKVREEFLALFRTIGQSQGFQTLVTGSLTLASSLIKVADATKGLLPALSILAAFKGASALTQFASGFGGGFRRGSGQRANAPFADGGPVRRFARGGLVPGSGNRDTVPAMLMPGEFVIRKKAVQTLGTDRLHRMNKYANGGIAKETTVGVAVLDAKNEIAGSDEYTINKGDFSQYARTTDRQMGLKYLPKGRGYTVVRETLDDKLKPLFNKAIDTGIVSGLEKSLSELGAEYAIPLPLSSASAQAFLKGINDATRGNVFESMLTALSTNGNFDPDANPQAPFDYVGGFQGKLASSKLFQRIRGLNYIDAKASEEQSRAKNIAPKILLQLFKENTNNAINKQQEQKELFKNKNIGEEIRDYDVPKGMTIAELTQKGIIEPAGVRGKYRIIRQKLASGGIAKAPLIDDILENASGSILPSKFGLEQLLQIGYGALDFDRTLQRTTGDAAYAKAKTPAAKEAVLSKYFRDRSNRLSDIKNARLTQFGKALQEAIKNKKIDPNNLSIISKSSRVPGLAEHINNLFGIPMANMIFTSGASKESALEALRTKGPRASRIQRFALGGQAEPELYRRGSTTVYSIEDMKKAAERKGMTLEQLKALLEERQDNEWKDYVIPYYDVSKKFDLFPYQPPPSDMYTRVMAAKIDKEDRIESWKQKQGMVTRDYEGRTEREKNFLQARQRRQGFANGGAAGGDTVPALLTPGEFVINKKAAQKIGLAKLSMLNRADKVQGYNKGGVVGGGIIQKFATGGMAFDALSSLGVAISRLVPKQDLKPTLSARPGNIGSGTVEISNEASNNIRNLVNQLNAAGVSAASLAEIIKKGGQISYEAAQKALEEDIKRLKITGASLEQITQAETTLASVRASGQQEITKRQFLEAGFKESRTGSTLGSGAAQQQILVKAAQIEEKILAQKEKQLTAELRRTGLSQQQAELEARAQLSTAEQRNATKEQAFASATQAVTGVKKSELAGMNISGSDIQKYISESMRDRKTLAQMDKQLIASKLQEKQNEKAYQTASKAVQQQMLAEAKRLAQEEISVRRKMINDLAAQTGGRGVGAAGMFDFRNSPILNTLKNNFNPFKAEGFSRTASAISLASGALSGQGQNIAGMMYSNRTTEGRRQIAGTGAGIESATGIASAGMMLAAQTVMIPVVGPYIASIAAVGSAALAAADYFYDFTGSQKQAIAEFERQMRAKEIGDATDNLDKAFKNFESDMNNSDLQSALNDALSKAITVQARDTNANINDAQREYGLKNRGWSGWAFRTMPTMGAPEMQELQRAEADKYAQYVDKAYRQIQSQVDSGATLDQIMKNNNLRGARSAIALGDAQGVGEFYKQSEAKKAELGRDLTDDERQAIIDSIAARKIEQSDIIKNAIKTKELADAMDEANRAGRELSRSFAKLFDTVNQSINRIQYESKQRQALLDSNVAARRGQAEWTDIDLRELNVLSNPQAYKDDPQAFNNAVDTAANMLGGTQGEMLRGAAKLQQQLPDAMTQAIANDLRTNQALSADAAAARAKETGIAQIKALNLPDDVTQTLINKLTADIDQKREELKGKFEQDPSAATNIFIESIRNTSTALGEVGGEAVEAARKLIEERQRAFNQFGRNLQAAAQAAKQAANYFRAAKNIRAKGDIDLREAQTGVGETYQEAKARLDSEVKELTGGVTDPAAIRQNIDNLSSQRQIQQAQLNQAVSSGNKDEAQKMAESLQKTDTALNNNREALDRLANSADVAQKALEEVSKIRELQQNREDFANKLLTSTPEELDNLNKAFVRLQRNLNGGLNNASNQRDARKAFNETLRRTGSVREATRAGNTVLAEQRKETLALMKDSGYRAMVEMNIRNQAARQGKDVSPVDIDNMFRKQEAQLMKQMAIESGMMNNPMIRDAIAAKEDPNADPAMKRAADQFLQAVGLQAKATEEQGRIELANSQNILRTAVDDLNVSIRDLSSRIDNIYNTSPNNGNPDDPNRAPATDAAGERLVPITFANGGIVYAAGGKLIDFKPKGTDTVPAMLTPGEFVVNRAATAKHLPLLKAINSGSAEQQSTHLQKGGVVYLAGGGKPEEKDNSWIGSSNLLVSGLGYFEGLGEAAGNAAYGAANVVAGAATVVASPVIGYFAGNSAEEVARGERLQAQTRAIQEKQAAMGVLGPQGTDQQAALAQAQAADYKGESSTAAAASVGLQAMAQGAYTAVEAGQAVLGQGPIMTGEQTALQKGDAQRVEMARQGFGDVGAAATRVGQLVGYGASQGLQMATSLGFSTGTSVAGQFARTIKPIDNLQALPTSLVGKGAAAIGAGAKAFTKTQIGQDIALAAQAVKDVVTLRGPARADIDAAYGVVGTMDEYFDAARKTFGAGKLSPEAAMKYHRKEILQKAMEMRNEDIAKANMYSNLTGGDPSKASAVLRSQTGIRGLGTKDNPYTVPPRPGQVLSDVSAQAQLDEMRKPGGVNYSAPAGTIGDPVVVGGRVDNTVKSSVNSVNSTESVLPYIGRKAGEGVGKILRRFGIGKPKPLSRTTSVVDDVIVDPLQANAARVRAMEAEAMAQESVSQSTRVSPNIDISRESLEASASSVARSAAIRKKMAQDIAQDRAAKASWVDAQRAEMSAMSPQQRAQFDAAKAARRSGQPSSLSAANANANEAISRTRETLVSQLSGKQATIYDIMGAKPGQPIPLADIQSLRRQGSRWLHPDLPANRDLDPSLQAQFNKIMELASEERALNSYDRGLRMGYSHDDLMDAYLGGNRFDLKKLKRRRPDIDPKGKPKTPAKYANGGIVYANNGQLISARNMGTDTVPAMLTPGEFVINRRSAQQHMPVLQAINSGKYNRGGIVTYLANGGLVQPPRYYQRGGAVSGQMPASGGVSNDISKAINSAMAGLGNVVGQISQLKEVYTMVQDSVAQLSNTAQTFVTGLSDTSFNITAASQNLSQVSIPDTINFTGNIENKHVFNGAEAANQVLSTLGSTMEQTANNKVSSVFNNLNRGAGQFDSGVIGPDISSIMGGSSANTKK